MSGRVLALNEIIDIFYASAARDYLRCATLADSIGRRARPRVGRFHRQHVAFIFPYHQLTWPAPDIIYRQALLRVAFHHTAESGCRRHKKMFPPSALQPPHRDDYNISRH